MQRSFSDGFRPDLVDVQACVASNGETLLAEDCASDADFVSFVDSQLVSASGACHSGHDDQAQVTVDPNGENCVTSTTTSVTATDP